MARPRFTPTREDRAVVTALLINGVPLETCRLHVTNRSTHKPVSYKTFTAAFNDEIATAVATTNAEVCSNLYRIATANNESAATVTAAIFWMRTRCGWKFADASTPPQLDDGPEMVGTEARARQIIAEELEKYGRPTRGSLGAPEFEKDDL